MKEFEKIESLLKTKAYNELSKEERLLVDQELSKEAYDELRSAMYLLKEEKLAVSKDVKQSLLAEFKPRKFSPRKFSRWAAINRKKVPAYSLVIPLLFLIAIFWYRPIKEVPVIQNRVVEVMVRDTVKVMKTDTLWQEKIVRVPQLVYVEKEESSQELPESEVVSRSLGEQKEVLDLVVRVE